MKQFMYILVLLLFGAQHYTAQAQEGPYKSIFGKDSTRWNIVYKDIADVVPPRILSQFLIFKEDTLMDGKYYKKTYMVSRNTVGQPLYPVNHYIREDTITGKVWSRRVEDTTDRLLIDFGLSPGDTFVGLGFNAYTGVVDSTAIVAGRKRIYLRNLDWRPRYLYSREYPLVFIEGVGSVGNHVLDIIVFSHSESEYLLCSYKDGVQEMAYVNEKYGGDCSPNLNTTSVAALHKQQVSIAPNPAMQQVQLAQLPAIEHTITLLDVQGRVLERAVNASPSYLLDVAAYAPGMYILRVDAAGYSPYVQKIEKR